MNLSSVRSGRRRPIRLARWAYGFFLVIGASSAAAAEIRVAVAANFADCLAEIGTAFCDSTGHRLVVSRGSTGRHFAQILAGAPFDVFLAADAARCARLEAADRIVPGTRFTYAEGRLALWIPGARPEDRRDAVAQLQAAEFAHLAMANPRLAPYGLAARQVLETLGLWSALEPRLVTGQSVGQAWQFVASGNAEAGLVAYPQIRAAAGTAGRWWKLDPPLHDPILQQAVLLADAENPAAGRRFLDFLKSPAAHMILIRAGYLIPEN